MVKHVGAESSVRPEDIVIESKKVFLYTNIVEKEKFDDVNNKTYFIYRFDIEEYTKDEYLIKLQQDLNKLAMILEGDAK